MAYSDFTLRKVKQSFGLTAVEGGRFLPEVEPIAPSAILAGLLEDTVPWAIAVGTEKAKKDLIKLTRIQFRLFTVHSLLSDLHLREFALIHSHLRLIYSLFLPQI